MSYGRRAARIFSAGYLVCLCCLSAGIPILAGGKVTAPVELPVDKAKAALPGPVGSSAGAKSPSPVTINPSTQATGTTPRPASTSGLAASNNPAVKPRISEAQKDFCNLLWNCSLPVPAGYCPDPSLVEKPKFSFDSTRCQEARTMNARGLTPAHPLLGFKLYRFLGMEYRVVYTVEDAIPISEARLAYLLADLPLSAKLVSHFQKEPYEAQYLDAERTHFQGTKGKHLKGDATLISGSTQEKHLFYFGYGIATVAWWTLRGPAYMDFSYATDPAKDKLLRYRMKILVFPGNGFINGIMNLGLFKKVVLGKIREVLDDITQSAQKLAATGQDKILESKDWTPDDKKKIAEFLKLP